MAYHAVREWRNLADAQDLGSCAARRGGSNPFSRTIFNRTCGSSSVVEHRLAKARVAGSNPVFRSNCCYSPALAGVGRQTSAYCEGAEV